ncbi:hypothetical protein BpHYR1_033980 [Brachionus plicatilis]|uniref:Uncharacterized protein n=1 Tax=Brachionus plicatilis TaxID=10195 RepID=A0A3M7R3Y9_BRAPC|nr:hypothetical protein BpHYR1_033980 [Brachionus plicatilis]
MIFRVGSCTLPGQLPMDNHICLISGQIFYFIVHVFFQLSTCISNCPVKKESLSRLEWILSPSFQPHDPTLNISKC